MIRTRQTLGVGLIAVFLVTTAVTVVTAAPVPPLLVVNHDARQCAEIPGGDECMDCFPPSGWEILGQSSQNECPQGYATVHDLDYSCQGFKNQRCCTEGHSGAHGTCDEMVVNNRQERCAFVETLENCTLRKNWESKPADLRAVEWSCPAAYEWVDDSLACAADATSGEEAAAAESGGAFCPFATIIFPGAILVLFLTRKIH